MIDAFDSRPAPNAIGHLKWRVERLRIAPSLEVGEAIVPSRDLTLEAYERRGFLPLWTDARALDDLLEAIAASLAELVLADPARWTRATLEAAIDVGETRTIRLPSPVPVYVLCWTAAVDLDGKIHFHRDVYGRDAAVLAALDAAPLQGTQAGSSR